jgi:hypothetical protein
MLRVFLIETYRKMFCDAIIGDRLFQEMSEYFILRIQHSRFIRPLHWGQASRLLKQIVWILSYLFSSVRRAVPLFWTSYRSLLIYAARNPGPSLPQARRLFS